MVLWALIITFVLYFLYDDIKYRIRMHKLYKKAFQELDEQEKETIVEWLGDIKCEFNKE